MHYRIILLTDCTLSPVQMPKSTACNHYIKLELECTVEKVKMTAGLLQTVSESSKNGPRVARVRRKRPLGRGWSYADGEKGLLHDLPDLVDGVRIVSTTVPGPQQHQHVAISAIIM